MDLQPTSGQLAPTNLRLHSLPRQHFSGPEKRYGTWIDVRIVISARLDPRSEDPPARLSRENPGSPDTHIHLVEEPVKLDLDVRKLLAPSEKHQIVDVQSDQRQRTLNPMAQRDPSSDGFLTEGRKAVYQCQHSYPLTLGLELLRHLKSDQSAKTMAAQEIRPL